MAAFDLAQEKLSSFSAFRFLYERLLGAWARPRSEEHTSELQSLMRNSYAVFCLKKKKELLYDQSQDQERTRRTIKTTSQNTKSTQRTHANTLTIASTVN